MNGKRLTFCFLVLALLGGGAVYLYWQLTAQAPGGGLEEAGEEKKSPSTKAGEDTAAAKNRRQLLGVWQDNYQGKRTMTLKDDGTGTMLVELSGLQAALFAAKLRFDMRWTLTDKILTKRTVGGEPADRVNLILNTMGNTAEDTILEISDQRLLLLDKDGKTQYDWQRVKPEE